jgi:hypothetical protein
VEEGAAAGGGVTLPACGAARDGLPRSLRVEAGSVRDL